MIYDRFEYTAKKNLKEQKLFYRGPYCIFGTRKLYKLPQEINDLTSLNKKEKDLKNEFENDLRTSNLFEVMVHGEPQKKIPLQNLIPEEGFNRSGNNFNETG